MALKTPKHYKIDTVKRFGIRYKDTYYWHTRGKHILNVLQKHEQNIKSKSKKDTKRVRSKKK